MSFSIRRAKDSGSVGFVMPTGTVVPFAGSAAPTGWLLCFGQTVSRTTYPDLFATIGTNYGSGDGSTTFALPDMRGRIPAGKDDMGGSAASRLTSTTITSGATTLGNSGGAQTHTLSESELASHNHTQNAHNHGPGNETHFVTVSTQTVGGIAGSGVYQAPYNKASTTANTTATNNATGGGGAHNNVQPTIILNYIIKA